MASNLEQLMAWILRLATPNIKWEQEYAFAKPRRWRFDFAWVAGKVAVEVEGGTFSQGRHTRGVGFHNDLEKYNQAAVMGWLVLRFDKELLETTGAETVRAAIETRKAQEGPCAAS